MKFRSWIDLVKTAAKNWSADFAPSMGAALAYYTVFSIAPLLVIAIAVAALIFDQQTVQEAIMAQAHGLVGPEGAAAIETMLESAQRPKEGVVASVLGVGALILGATTVFNELETALNRIWKVEAPKGSGIWHFLRTRVLSFGMVLAIGFLLLVSLIISAALAAWGTYWGGLFQGWEVFLQVVNFIVSFAVITVLFAVIYKMLPQTKIDWRDVWVGALVTAALFTVGKTLIGLYIGKSSVASSYGAAGAFVILLVWVYYSAQIFLFGAEFTKEYASRHGSLKREEGAKGSVTRD